MAGLEAVGHHEVKRNAHALRAHLGAMGGFPLRGIDDLHETRHVHRARGGTLAQFREGGEFGGAYQEGGLGYGRYTNLTHVEAAATLLAAGLGREQLRAVEAAMAEAPCPILVPINVPTPKHSAPGGLAHHLVLERDDGDNTLPTRPAARRSPSGKANERCVPSRTDYHAWE